MDAVDPVEARLEKLAASVRPYVERANELAARHAEVTTAHLVAALLEHEEVGHAIAACGADPEEVADVVAGTVDELARRRWWHLGGAVSAEVHAIIGRALDHALGAELDVIRPTRLLVHVLAAVPDSIVVGRIDAMGVERLPLTLLVEHGDPRDLPLPAGTGPARVMAYNDSFTTKELVVTLLVECFGHAVDDAERLMHAIHKSGAPAAVYADEWEQARERAEAARRRARARGYPLRLTIVPGRGP